MLFIGIDTSNYTTSAALCDESGHILANLKKPLPVSDGACGLRQSDAVFAHVRNLPEVMDRLSSVLALATAAGNKIAAVGVSSKPRDAADSYMPCFLSGVAASHAFSSAANVPLFEFSHQQGHIMAAYRTSGAEDTLGYDSRPFLAFHVSGGTTEVVLATAKKEGFEIRLIGGTRDCSAGQIIDRTGVMLGMHFPCGPEMERLAVSRGNLPLPKWKISVDGTHCNLSGLQNLAQKYRESGASDADVCAAVFDFIARTLAAMSANARTQFGDIPVVWAGGVMSCSVIKNRLAAEHDTYFTEPQCSADNAVGTALLCRRRYMNIHGNVQ